MANYGPCVKPGCPRIAQYKGSGMCRQCLNGICIECKKRVADRVGNICDKCRYGRCLICGRVSDRSRGLCNPCHYGQCRSCDASAVGPHGLCNLHRDRGPDYIAKRGWKASHPGIVYLAEWPGFTKIGIGIDQRRADLWSKHGADLHAVVDMGTKAAASYVETSMKEFMASIGERAFESADVAPRYLQAKTGWAECWIIDDLYLDAVRGEFERLTSSPVWGGLL